MKEFLKQSEKSGLRSGKSSSHAGEAQNRKCFNAWRTPVEKILNLKDNT